MRRLVERSILSMIVDFSWSTRGVTECNLFVRFLLPSTYSISKILTRNDQLFVAVQNRLSSSTRYIAGTSTVSLSALWPSIVMTDSC